MRYVLFAGVGSGGGGARSKRGNSMYNVWAGTFHSVKESSNAREIHFALLWRVQRILSRSVENVIKGFLNVHRTSVTYILHHCGISNCKSKEFRQCRKCDEY